MSAGRLRVEVENEHGATVLYVDQVLDQLSEVERLRLIAEVRDLLEALGDPDALHQLLAVLAQETADARAYEREAARRGHLAL